MGFIKLPDNLNEWAWYGDNNALIVYIRLRFEAKYKDTDVGNVHLERGQVLTSISELAEKCSLTIQQTRTTLERLKSTNKITIKPTPRYSVITLIDYDPEEENDTPSNNPITNYQHTNQQTDNKLITNSQQTDNKASLLTTNSKQANSKQARTREEPEPKSPDVKQPNKPEKRKFAEFVSMTNDEYSLLVTKLGEQGAKRCIEILDNYKGSSGKTYKSDYRAILSWVVSRYNEENARCKPAQNKSSSASDSGNPFLDMLRELEEKEANEIDVQGNVTGNGGA